MLIDTERDTAAELRAEDEAIAAAERGEAEEPPIPLGGELAELIARLTDDGETDLHG